MVSIDLIQFLKSSPYVYTEWYSEGAENGLTVYAEWYSEKPDKPDQTRNRVPSGPKQTAIGPKHRVQRKQGEPLRSDLLWARFSMDIIHHPIYES
tara:strand:+ start:322 stop:606 length:285 start_codon:yes stop_codon:yes gene_type:complete